METLEDFKTFQILLNNFPIAFNNWDKYLDKYLNIIASVKIKLKKCHLSLNRKIQEKH